MIKYNLIKDKDFFQGYRIFNNLPYVSFVANYNIKEAEELLNGFFAELENADYIPANLYGLSGIGLTLNYLSKRSNSFKYIEDNFKEDYSELILTNSQEMFRIKNYDTFERIISCLNYFICIKDIKATCELTDKLFLLANRLIKDNIDDLGQAHGLSGIISCLSKSILFLKEENNNIYVDYLASFVNYLANTKKTNSDNLLYRNNKSDITSRLAWCYGDLSIATAFTWYYKVTKNEEFLEKVKEIISNLIQYDPKDCLVFYNEKDSYYDLGICHGLSGIVLVLKRINSIIKCNKITDYIDDLLNTIKSTLSLIGDNQIEFPNSTADKNIIWAKNTSFLEGTIGVYFVLADEELKRGWDSFLLTDFDSDEIDVEIQND